MNLFVKGNLSGDVIVLNQYLVRDLKKLNLWGPEMVERLKYFNGEIGDIDNIPDNLKEKYKTAFSVDHSWLILAAGRRQKWIDQSQSVNLFLANPEIKTLSHMYRAAWHNGLETTYYLRTVAASNIEQATGNVQKELRHVGAEKDDPSTDAPPQKEFTDAEKQACSLEALMNGDECEACQ